MNISQVSKSLDKAYNISIDNLNFFYNNQPGPSVSKKVSKNYYTESGKADKQNSNLNDIYLNVLKAQIAVNRPDFDKAIQDLEEYNNDIQGNINNIETASKIIVLIAEVLSVFGL